MTAIPPVGFALDGERAGLGQRLQGDPPIRHPHGDGARVSPRSQVSEGWAGSDGQSPGQKRR
ncbi:hypothetical protein [Microbacterium sp.]|uniref:hypothetical protein n=1 Tax=Microbacterium sp. TaxID=51671 RepID=UPI003A923DEF